MASGTQAFSPTISYMVYGDQLCPCWWSFCGCLTVSQRYLRCVTPAPLGWNLPGFGCCSIITSGWSRITSGWSRGSPEMVAVSFQQRRPGRPAVTDLLPNCLSLPPPLQRLTTESTLRIFSHLPFLSPRASLFSRMEGGVLEFFL
jgi:hypothetical protein